MTSGVPIKFRRRVSVTKIRLTLITIVAVQFPNLICFFPSQISSVLSEDIVPQNFQDIDFTNITFLDSIARKAMQKLHDDLDHDDDGNVSVIEGAKFIDREEFVHSGGSNLPGFATDKDGRITESEFWDSWVHCEVHNWTLNQMVEWLSNEVDLPQYANNFRKYGISGAAMPILASNSSLVLSLVDGVKEHRFKLWLKAMEIVLCGFTYSKSNFLKDVLVAVSVGLAIGGVAYGFRVRYSASLAVAALQDKLDNLQNDMKNLDEDIWLKDLSPDEDRETNLNRVDCNSSQSSLLSEASLQSRLQEVQEELASTKLMLEQAEEQLNQRKWAPPSRLVTCLKNTHKVEMKLHTNKRTQAQKKVEQAKSQFVKMKKKTSIFNSVQLLHSRQVDNFDLEIQAAKDFLREVQLDSHESRKRWLELESICRCKFATSTAKIIETKQHSSLRMESNATPNGGSFIKHRTEMDSISLQSNSTSADYSSNVAPSGGLHMKDIVADQAEIGDTDSDSKSQRNNPTSPASNSTPHEHRRSEPVSHSSTGILPKASSLRKSPTVIPDAVRLNISKNFQTFPRKQPSPKMPRSKGSVQSCVIVTTEPEPEKTKRGISPNRTPSFGSSDVQNGSTLRPERRSVSSRSLPDMTSETREALLKRRDVDVQSTPSHSIENGKPPKKRGNFGSFFKRKKK